jgi:hypothetical protein
VVGTHVQNPGLFVQRKRANEFQRSGGHGLGLADLGGLLGGILFLSMVSRVFEVHGGGLKKGWQKQKGALGHAPDNTQNHRERAKIRHKFNRSSCPWRLCDDCE